MSDLEKTSLDDPKKEAPSGFEPPDVETKRPEETENTPASLEPESQDHFPSMLEGPDADESAAGPGHFEPGEVQGQLEPREDDRRGEPEDLIIEDETAFQQEPPERKELPERHRDRERHGNGRSGQPGRRGNFHPHGGNRPRPFTNDVRHRPPGEKPSKREILVNCSAEETR